MTTYHYCEKREEIVDDECSAGCSEFEPHGCPCNCCEYEWNEKEFSTLEKAIKWVTRKNNLPLYL